jgi:hypothetical protein
VIWIDKLIEITDKPVDFVDKSVDLNGKSMKARTSMGIGLDLTRRSSRVRWRCRGHPLHHTRNRAANPSAATCTSRWDALARARANRFGLSSEWRAAGAASTPLRSQREGHQPRDSGTVGGRDSEEGDSWIVSGGRDSEEGERGKCKTKRVTEH